MSPSARFPNLTATNHTETSPATPRYNCVAWAAEDTDHWWQPGTFWLPADWPGNDFGLAALETAFRELGYEDVGGDYSLDPGTSRLLCTAPDSCTRTPHANSPPGTGRASSERAWISNTTPRQWWRVVCTATWCRS